MENANAIETTAEDIVNLAIEKIKKETENFIGGMKEKVVYRYVSEVIQRFCEQDIRFAEVIYKFKRTLSDCCTNIMKETDNAASDIDVYRKAVQFYFPNTDIRMTMTIDVSGEAPSDEEISKEPEKPPVVTLPIRDNKPIAVKQVPRAEKIENKDEPIQLSF